MTEDIPMDRRTLAAAIASRLEPMAESLTSQWRDNGGRYLVVDDLLDERLALDIRSRFPKPADMMVRKSLREHKYVAAQMDRFDPLLEEIVFGFQEQVVRTIVERITGLKGLLPDSRLYAGGISLMAQGQFLNPHLDNSHDNDRKVYRVLNLLYYVSPDWHLDNGGNLELWPNGPKGPPLTIHSKFNRLAIMATDQASWHSVNRIRRDDQRCCVSNYFFSETPPHGKAYFHVTSFRGRPEEPLRNAALKLDVMLRTGIRKAFPKGLRETKHIYKK